MSVRLWAVPVFAVLMSGSLQARQDSGVAALVNGQPILMQDVKAAAANAIARVERQKAIFDVEAAREREQVLEAALARLMEERLLAAEASNRGVSVERLLSREVEGGAAPTNEEVERFYEANKQWLEGTLADNADAIRSLLVNTGRNARRTAYVEKLRMNFRVSSFLEPLRTSVPAENRPSKGSAAAPVTVVEFSDFECPYCAGLFPTLKRLAEDYAETVRIVYLQFPLAELHPHALKTAEASLCAFEQGKFWELHDLMFQDQGHLEAGDLKAKASTIVPDQARFDMCMDTGKFFDAVRTDVEVGTRLGVTGTPALFINGRLLVGNQPYERIREIVEDELRRSRTSPELQSAQRGQ